MTLNVDEFKKLLWELLGLFVGAVFLSGPAVFLYQAYCWLKDGAWPPIPFSRVLDWMGLGYPQFSWVGFQKIVDWVFGLPLSVGLFSTVILAFFGFLWLLNDMEEQKRLRDYADSLRAQIKESEEHHNKN